MRRSSNSTQTNAMLAWMLRCKTSPNKSVNYQTNYVIINKCGTVAKSCTMFYSADELRSENVETRELLGAMQNRSQNVDDVVQNISRQIGEFIAES
jgi:hypothetical protein